MKYLANLLALAFLISVGACSSEGIFTDEPSNNEETGITEISAVIGKLQYEDTRTAVTMEDFNSSSIKLVWADKDTIGIYPTEGDQLSFPIVEGVGTNKCIFNGGGWALKTSTSYKAYSPFNRAYYYHESDKLPVSMFGQKQIGNGNSDHIGKYDLQIAEGKTPDTGKISFEFKHQVCFIRMDLTAPIAASWESITLESDALFTTEASMDISSETPSLTATTTANSVTLDLENVKTEEGETITAYMVVLPINFTDKTLNVILTDSNGSSFKLQTTIANDYRNFKAGYARWIKAEYKSVIQYTGANSSTIEPYNKNGFNVDIISNTSGEMVFNGTLTTINSSAFYSTKLSSIIIPEGVKDIGYKAFNQCQYLSDISLPNSLISIGESAFTNCSIGRIIVPDNVTTIGVGAFVFCESLSYVNLPSSLTTIGDGAFQECKSLQKITIPENITSLGSMIFYNCNNLAEIYCKATVPPTLNGSLLGSSPNANLRIYVPTNSVDIYKGTDKWKDYESCIQGFDF